MPENEPLMPPERTPESVKLDMLVRPPEELDELFEISDRMVVMAQGRISPSLPTAEATIERIGAWMSGLWDEPSATAAAAAASKEGARVTH
jgi:ABC-type sugar transport system ATPase subunit